MRIAEGAPIAAAPAGWSPGAVSPSTSTRAPGLVRGGLDAWMGRPERSAGVPLTSVQVTMLAPFLAREAKLDESVVLEDLRAVRVHVGGLAHDAGNTATTIGPHIYVSDAARATRILSWEGRRWLVHELGHTMQWRRTGASQASDAARDRTFLNHYIGAFASYDGSVKQGGLVNAFREWQRRRDAGEPTPAKQIPDLLHDFHPMEQEAERIAVAFRDANP
jgi:hypothetical protein